MYNPNGLVQIKASSRPPELVDPARHVGWLSNRVSHESKRASSGSMNWLRKTALWRVCAPKLEQLFLGGSLLMFWLISAASLSGYIIIALFVLVAIGRLVRHVVTTIAAKLPRRSQLRHYLVLGMSVAFFSLLAFRACYLATVVVDTQFGSNPFQARSSTSQR